jgi:hypothetical protein
VEARVAPFASLVAEGFRATIPTGSTITTRRPEGDFVLRASDELDVEGATLSLALDVWRGRRARVTAGPVVAYLSYVGIERGDYEIGIDRHGYNLGAFAGLEVGLAGRWAVVSEIEHLSLVRIDGFESGFEIDPVLLSTGLRFGW